MTDACTADLSGIPETTLWTLHNRASEALRPDRTFEDPDAVRIYRGISYPFLRHFGRPDGSHAVRSRRFDDALQDWLRIHPDGQVVELGCGLETQFLRCDNGQVRWLAIDVPEALAVRERFIRHPRCLHLAGNALDLEWLDWVDAEAPVFISAQGLLMYFDERAAARLVWSVVTRFPQATLVFDVVPRWFSALAQWRLLRKTRHYAAPAMSWGLNRREIVPRVRRWTGATRVTVVPYGPIRGAWGFLFRRLGHLPGLRAHVGHVVQVSAPAAAIIGPRPDRVEAPPSQRSIAASGRPVEETGASAPPDGVKSRTKPRRPKPQAGDV